MIDPNHHGLKSYEATLEEVPNSHFIPAVVIGIANHKTRKEEKEVDGEVTVVDDLV